MNIFVANIHFSLSEDQLKDLFEAYGEVSSVKIVKDHDTGKSKGYGFISMADQASGNLAIKELNDREINGKKLVVNQAKPREEKRKSFGGPKGGGSNYGY